MFPNGKFHVVSLGTGTAKPKEFDPTLSTVAGQLADIITNTQTRADDFERDWNSNDGRYFRFSPPFLGDVGLEEADKLEDIRRFAVDYIDETRTGREFVGCAMQLAEPVGESLNQDSIPLEAGEQSLLERLRNLPSPT